MFNSLIGIPCLKCIHARFPAAHAHAHIHTARIIWILSTFVRSLINRHCTICENATFSAIIFLWPVYRRQKQKGVSVRKISFFSLFLFPLCLTQSFGCRWVYCQVMRSNFSHIPIHFPPILECFQFVWFYCRVCDTNHFQAHWKSSLCLLLIPYFRYICSVKLTIKKMFQILATIHRHTHIHNNIQIQWVCVLQFRCQLQA